MPAKPKGGKRQKRANQKDADFARELIMKEEGEEYAIVLKELGNRILRAYCMGDGKLRRCHIPKKIRERVKCGDVILVTRREYASTDDEADIFHKYHKDEVKQLQEFGHIPEDLDAILEAEATKIGVDVKKEIAAAAAEIAAEELEENYGKTEKVNDDDIDDL
ncbi:Eukaryotic_translation initiation factor 1A [Hexamita inflata]|uniref:Eukaryotic translation initiation factor 1A n=1 Tax=Hexamita inflata TaxID=28002 RepID=A0AA86UTZ0_9EUKA|nr:Eukaryotic translation initiation factor 1A [Hexamita inflata]CAI9930851.1 Eukaryotic translation initiation factor 1A [Hexamita inflata]CAI9933562.1 Eukaryotic translation initiation factor 1A [Hexamita inflata]CAI9969680.1 Eukaryotic translation initiation factor 1A [Hexamita inflata]CAI9971665.1 Eukaryotic translation initiation factor 1A [Hexamita inflata]